MNKYMKCLSDNLQYLMNGMSVSELAKEVHIPQPTLSRYIACKRQITLENLVLLADYFNIEIDALIGRKDFYK